MMRKLLDFFDYYYSINSFYCILWRKHLMILKIFNLCEFPYLNLSIRCFNMDVPNNKRSSRK